MWTPERQPKGPVGQERPPSPPPRSGRVTASGQLGRWPPTGSLFAWINLLDPQPTSGQTPGTDASPQGLIRLVQRPQCSRVIPLDLSAGTATGIKCDPVFLFCLSYLLFLHL